MNLYHRWYCRSDGWAFAVRRYVMPWVLDGVDLGENVLEIGPGPGVTTDWLRERVAALTSIEIDRKLARALKSRLEGVNVTVIEGDATSMPFPDGSFTGAVSLTMLHHVPSAELQDRLLAETHRVLKPGSAFAGTDSIPSLKWNLIHLFDTRVPVDPATFSQRLERAGFVGAEIELYEPSSFRFRARKPG